MFWGAHQRKWSTWHSPAGLTVVRRRYLHASPPPCPTFKRFCDYNLLLYICRHLSLFLFPVGVLATITPPGNFIVPPLLSPQIHFKPFLPSSNVVDFLSRTKIMMKLFLVLWVRLHSFYLSFIVTRISSGNILRRGIMRRYHARRISVINRVPRLESMGHSGDYQLQPTYWSFPSNRHPVHQW